VSKSLSTILSSGTFSQAYLFTGPKGTGKTSSARILAKLLNCEKNKQIVQDYKKGSSEGGKKGVLHEPCGECDSCRAIVAGSSMAVLEMDAASNRGIDDIRQLRERIGLVTSQGEMTVYVIDEVHMLTTEAFNALLKTLEEPPRHVVFALCTTEAHKVPDTIKSRCMEVKFVKASTDEVVRSLSKAVKGEKLLISPEALQAIAMRVDGSFRDGMKLLEQLSQGSGEISIEMVDELTKYSHEYEVEELVQALLDKNVSRGLAVIGDKEKAGVDFSLLAKRLVEELRRLLISEVMQAKPDEEQVVVLRELNEVVLSAVTQIKYAPIPQLNLELALVDWSMRDVNKSRADNGQPDDGTTYVTPKPNIDVEVNNSKKAKKVETSEPEKEIMQEKNEQVKPVHQNVIEVEKLDANVPTLEMVTIRQAWPRLMQAVKPFNHSLEALLRAVEPGSCEARTLTLRVFYNFHKEQLEQERHRIVLEEVFTKELGGPVVLQFELGSRKGGSGTREIQVDNVTGKLEDENLAQAAEEIFGA
jgi:DNA polymerase-3 subunit gamma/tau